ncbi:hypothetical protein C0J52_17571 [Blattella germanica]|nr:hypothetical protein C0J52_17571 [Blattella germanica]
MLPLLECVFVWATDPLQLKWQILCSKKKNSKAAVAMYRCTEFHYINVLYILLHLVYQSNSLSMYSCTV